MDDQQALSDEEIEGHCAEIERCNQRGGRMLSLVDLLRSATVDLDLAAHLATVVCRGASFLVGALPGGAGKTTVMYALLNFVPPDRRLIAADSLATIRRGLASADSEPLCYICHEIGSGPYYAYLWGQGARDFFALPAAGQMIATNLHADTLDQCRRQLCEENGVRPDDFHRCRLCLFLVHTGSWSHSRRRIATVYESDGHGPHQLVWRWDSKRDTFARVGESRLVPSGDPDVAALRDVLREMVTKNTYTIDGVRRGFVGFMSRSNSRH